jgi:hypothetical protein
VEESDEDEDVMVVGSPLKKARTEGMSVKSIWEGRGKKEDGLISDRRLEEG